MGFRLALSKHKNKAIVLFVLYPTQNPHPTPLPETYPTRAHSPATEKLFGKEEEPHVTFRTDQPARMVAYQDAAERDAIQLAACDRDLRQSGQGYGRAWTMPCGWKYTRVLCVWERQCKCTVQCRMALEMRVYASSVKRIMNRVALRPAI